VLTKAVTKPTRLGIVKSKIKTLLFDLGGVLVDWDGTTPLVELSNRRLGMEQARRFWMESPSVRNFEIGKSMPEQFARGAIAELGLQTRPQEFLSAFASWDRGPFPGTLLLLKNLKPDFTLACLSNNNPIHWRRPELHELLAFFDRCFVSFETGVLKPDRVAFEHVLAEMAVRPEEILFFDDNPECVETALHMGMASCRVKGVEAVRTKLVEMELYTARSAG